MTDSMNIPEDLKYTKDHEWVRLEGDVATVGITDHAQQAMGEITYVDLPPEGKDVARGDDMAAVESAKAASDIFAPVGGKVTEINPALEDTPEKVNQSPYDEGWICKLSNVNAADADNFLTPAQYAEYLQQEET